MSYPGAQRPTSKRPDPEPRPIATTDADAEAQRDRKRVILKVCRQDGLAVDNVAELTWLERQK